MEVKELCMRGEKSDSPIEIRLNSYERVAMIYILRSDLMAPSWLALSAD